MPVSPKVRRFLASDRPFSFLAGLRHLNIAKECQKEEVKLWFHQESYELNPNRQQIEILRIDLAHIKQISMK